MPEPRQPWELDRWYQQMVLDMAAWSYASEHGLHNMVMDHACALCATRLASTPGCARRSTELIDDTTFHVKHYDPLNRG